MGKPNMSAFVRSYLGTALWSSTDWSRDDGGDPLDANYSVDDVSPASVAAATEECAAFLEANRADIDASGVPLDTVAHDLWLTRNRHGAGFWDGDYPEAIGRRLTEASHAYGEVSCVVGDDGLIHIE